MRVFKEIVNNNNNNYNNRNYFRIRPFYSKNNYNIIIYIFFAQQCVAPFSCGRILILNLKWIIGFLFISTF